MSKRIIVIGHGMVGQRFLEALTKDGPGTSRSPCSRRSRGWRTTASTCPKFFAGTAAEDLTLTTRELLRQERHRAALGRAVASIDRAGKRVISKSGAEYEYDVLVLATGSCPFVPPIAGSDAAECFVYRTIEDLEAIRECGQALEDAAWSSAAACSGSKRRRRCEDLGLETHVVEFAPRLMAVQVDEGGGARCCAAASRNWA